MNALHIENPDSRSAYVHIAIEELRFYDYVATEKN